MNTVDAGDSYIILFCVYYSLQTKLKKTKYLYQDKSVGLAWEANSFPARKEILDILWKPIFH